MPTPTLLRWSRRLSRCILQGSIAGGTRLSVHGTGLGTPVDQDSVKVLLTAVHGNTVVPCPVVSVSASLIECDIPFAGIGITYMVGDYDVSLSVLSNLNRTSTNVVATTRRIQDHQWRNSRFVHFTVQISIAGATRVTLVGTGLGDENMTTVNVAGVLPCAIISANDTHVICNSPAQSAVVSTFIVALALTVWKGTCLRSPPTKVNFVSFPRVDNLTVPMGSSGSRLTIRGEGFDADAYQQHCGCDKVSIACIVVKMFMFFFSCALFTTLMYTFHLPIAYSVDTQCDGYNECWHTTAVTTCVPFAASITSLDCALDTISPQPQLDWYQVYTAA